MKRTQNIIDLSPAYDLAERAALALCRSLNLQLSEKDDLRQDLLVDLLSRLSAYDPERGSFGAFAQVCIRHAGSRIAKKVKRERAGRHPANLDDIIPGTEGLTLAETIPEDGGYAAWCGQPVNAIASLERRLDLDRAGAAIDPEDYPLCAALSQNTPHECGEQKLMPRMRIYRRIREMRLRLLAAGITSPA
jgi:RNA polymerase sigma-70 factor (ECF subfamily)